MELKMFDPISMGLSFNWLTILVKMSDSYGE